MSASKLVTIFCNTCGNWDGAGIGNTAREARAGLRGDDSRWVLGVPDPEGGRRLADYCCPEHHAKDQEATDDRG